MKSRASVGTFDVIARSASMASVVFICRFQTVLRVVMHKSRLKQVIVFNKSRLKCGVSFNKSRLNVA